MALKMAPKPKRPENKGLPKRWRLKHGAYFYQVPPGQEHLWDDKREFRLGKTLAEAYRTWSRRLDLHVDVRTIGELLDRYANEVVPKKAPKTQQSNLTSIRKLKAVFAAVPIPSLRPMHAYKYLDRRGDQGRTAANRDIEVLSHAYTKAIEWGLTDTHPIKGKVRKHSTPPRDRYVEDWELVEALKVASPFIRAYIGLKLLTGLRRGDLLRLKVSDLKEDGIQVQPHKTTRTSRTRITIQWSPALREAVNACTALRRKVTSIWLFCTRAGQPYIKEDGSANGFDSIWQRFMAKVLAETNVTDRFTEHDLRAKCASDAESLEHAQQLLAHAEAATTRRVYRRRGELVKPLK